MAPNLSTMQHSICFYSGNHCCSEFMSPTAMSCQEDIISLHVFLVSGSSFLQALFSNTPLALEVLDKLSHLGLNTPSSFISNMVSGSLFLPTLFSNALLALKVQDKMSHIGQHTPPSLIFNTFNLMKAWYSANLCI